MCIFKLELDLLLYCRVSQGNHSYPTYPFVPHCVAPVSEVPRKERRRKKKKSFVFFLSSCRICERGEILICHWCHGYWHFNNVVLLVNFNNNRLHILYCGTIMIATKSIDARASWLMLLFMLFGLNKVRVLDFTSCTVIPSYDCHIVY